MGKAKAKEKTLRFAVLIRVSTERQKARGESLLTQARQIEQAVESLGGKITARYEGQEHATPGSDRKLLDDLLKEAASSRKSFDAVMVADASRWSRDNAKSKAGLQLLRDHGVRFFTLTQEQNLFDPNAILFLGMAAEIGEYQARTQTLKSTLACIDRAKRMDACTTGHPPIGRVRHEKTKKLILDTRPWKKGTHKYGTAKAMIQDVAKRYLAGGSLPKLATEVGLNHAFLCVTLRKSCGDTHKMKWNKPHLNIREEVTIACPPLLDKKTIKSVQAMLDANRTYLQKGGRRKRHYLLSGYVRCGACGYVLCGELNRHGVRYYRHSAAGKAVCPLEMKRYVPADELENRVISDLAEVLGNPKALEKAIKLAIPNCDELQKEQARLTKDLAKNNSSRDRILAFVESESITDTEAKEKLDSLKQRKIAIVTKLDAINEELAAIPSRGNWAVEPDLMQGVDPDGNPFDLGFFSMVMDKSPENRRGLIEAAFGIPNHNNRFIPKQQFNAVYVTPIGPKSGGFRYVVRGSFGKEIRGRIALPSHCRARGLPALRCRERCARRRP